MFFEKIYFWPEYDVNVYAIPANIPEYILMITGLNCHTDAQINFGKKIAWKC